MKCTKMLGDDEFFYFIYLFICFFTEFIGRNILVVLHTTAKMHAALGVKEWR